MPAPTAWPFVLAFGFALAVAGLVTSMSVSVLGAVLALAGCIGWFREVFPYEHEEVVPVVPEDIRITTERRVVERLPIRTSSAGLASCPHLSGISGREGRTGGQRRHGSTGLRLRRAEGRKHLVSDQSSCRSRVRRIAEARARTALFISCRQLRDCLSFYTVSCLRWLVCSTARCCRCSRAARLCLEGSLARCYGRGSSTQSWACSIHCSPATLTGRGSLLRKWPSESWQACSCDARVALCRRGRICRLRYAQGSKLRGSLHREKAERTRSVNRFRYLYAFAVLSMLLSGCSSSPHGQPHRDSEAVAPEPDFGLRHSLRTELRGLPRRTRTRRSSDRAGQIPFISPLSMKRPCAK